MYFNSVLNVHPKLEMALVEFVNNPALANVAFYGYFASHLNFVETETLPTAGVGMHKARITFFYNPEFINSLTHKACIFLVVHEVMHLVSGHLVRLRGKGYDSKLANIAEDMIINSTAFADDTLAKHMEEPTNPKPLWIPKDYKGEWVAEELYDWLKQKQDQEGESGGSALDDILKEQGAIDPNGTGETFDIHPDELSEADAEVLQNMVEETIHKMKNRGEISGHMEEVLGKLNKKKNTYLKYLRQQIAEIKGSFHKDATWRRPNRYGLTGKKGKIKRGMAITVILDTSGSMHNEINKVLSTVLESGLDIQLVQVDTKVQAVQNITNPSDLRKVELKGFGGTILQPAIDYVVDKYNDGKGLVVMTDGYTDCLDLTSYTGRVVLLTTDKEPPHKSNGKTQTVLIDN